MQAVRLKEVDKDYRNHLQAFLNYAVRAQRKTGKYKTSPVFSKFKKFYNYEEEVKKAKKAKGEKSRFSGIGKLL
jgi:hypothetical protein